MMFTFARSTVSAFTLMLACLGISRAAVDGTVVDAVTGAPVAKAAVSFSPGAGPVPDTTSAVTDAQGHFHLPAPTEAVLPGRSERSRGGPFYGKRLLMPGERLDAGIAALAGAVDARGRKISFLPSVRAPEPRWFFLPEPDRYGNAAREDERAPSSSRSLAKTAAVTCVLTVGATGYRPREADCIDGGANRIEIAPVTSLRAFPNTPVQVGDGWTVDDAKVALPNMPSLQSMLDSLVSGKFKQVHSLLVVKGGKLIVEEYYRGNDDSIDFEHGIKRILKGDVQWTRTRKHYLASCNKSISNIIVGLALAKGGKPVTSLLSGFLPKYAGQFTGAKAGITVEHALTMTMGFQWDEWTMPDLAQMWATQDLIAYVLAKPNAAVPGTQWIYNSGGPNILLAAMESVVGDVARFGDTALFVPLGITDYRWEKQPTGQPEGAARMFMRPRDMAKLGYLYLKSGSWQGRQVVPADWVTVSTKLQKSAKPKSPNDYGYLWWIRKLTTPKGAVVNYYEAEGDGGQYIAVFPAQDMVVVFTGGNYGDSITYDGQIGRILAKGVLPACGF